MTETPVQLTFSYLWRRDANNSLKCDFEWQPLLSDFSYRFSPPPAANILFGLRFFSSHSPHHHPRLYFPFFQLDFSTLLTRVKFVVLSKKLRSRRRVPSRPPSYTANSRSVDGRKKERTRAAWETRENIWHCNKCQAWCSLPKLATSSKLLQTPMCLFEYILFLAPVIFP